MKYTKVNLLNKDFLEKEIRLHLNFVLSNIHLNHNYVRIHMQNGEIERKDYPRSMFAISVLSKIYSLQRDGKISKILNLKKEDILNLLKKIYNDAKNSSNTKEHIYTQLYAVKSLFFLNEDHAWLIEDFKKGDYGSIYTYPILTSLFMTVYNCSEEFKKWDFAKSIFNNCIKTFDYILYSNDQIKYIPMHFAELGMNTKIPKYLNEKNRKNIYDNLEKYLEVEKYATSGYAKMLEYFAFVEDFGNFEKFTEKINKRNIVRFKHFVNPAFLKYERIYTEDETHYICLDTNLHILQSLIILYEKII